MAESDLNLKNPLFLLQKRGLMNDKGITSQDLYFFEDPIAAHRTAENKDIRLSKECWIRMSVSGKEFTTKISAGCIVPEHLQNVEPVYAGKTIKSMFSEGAKY